MTAYSATFPLILQTFNASEPGRKVFLPRRKTRGHGSHTQHHQLFGTMSFSSFCIKHPHHRAHSKGKVEIRRKIQHCWQNISHGRRRQRRHRHSLCASFDTNVSANDSVIRMAAAAESGVRVKLFNCDDGSTVTELKLRRVGPCHEALTDASSVNRARSICDPSMIVYVLIVSMSVISTSLDRR